MERNNSYFRLYSFTLPATFYLKFNHETTMCCVGVFLESLQTGLKQQSISNKLVL